MTSALRFRNRVILLASVTISFLLGGLLVAVLGNEPTRVETEPAAQPAALDRDWMGGVEAELLRLDSRFVDIEDRLTAIAERVISPTTKILIESDG